MSLIELSENYFSDLRITSLSPVYPPSQSITIVLIDEQSLQNVAYQSPIDRQLISTLIDELEKQSVAAIGLNLRFDRPTEDYKDKILHDRLREISIPLVVSQVSDKTGYSQKQIHYSKKYLDWS